MPFLSFANLFRRNRNRLVEAPIPPENWTEVRTQPPIGPVGIDPTLAASIELDLEPLNIINEHLDPHDYAGNVIFLTAENALLRQSANHLQDQISVLQMSLNLVSKNNGDLARRCVSQATAISIMRSRMEENDYKDRPSTGKEKTAPGKESQKVPECNICHRPYSTDCQDACPRILLCGHTVCQDCASRIARNTSEIFCPFDRLGTNLKGYGIKVLPKNFALLDVVEKMSTKKAASE